MCSRSPLTRTQRTFPPDATEKHQLDETLTHRSPSARVTLTSETDTGEETMYGQGREVWYPMVPIPVTGFQAWELMMAKRENSPAIPASPLGEVNKRRGG